MENQELEQAERIYKEQEGMGIWRGLWVFIQILLYTVIAQLGAMEIVRALHNSTGKVTIEQVIGVFVTVFAYGWLLRMFQGRYWNELRLGDGFGWKNYVGVSALLIGYMNLYDTTLGKFILDRSQDSWYFEAFEDIMVNPLVAFVLVVIVAPIFEEIFLRGILLEQLGRRYNKGLMVLLTALLFGIMHFNLVQGVNAFFLGVFLGIIYLKSGSLLPCIYFHLLNNLVSYCFSIFGGPSLDVPSWWFAVGGALIFLPAFLYLVFSRPKASEAEGDWTLAAASIHEGLNRLVRSFVEVKLFGREPLFSGRFLWLFLIASGITYCISVFELAFTKDFHSLFVMTVFGCVLAVVSGFDRFVEERGWDSMKVYTYLDLAGFVGGFLILILQSTNFPDTTTSVRGEAVVLILATAVSFIRRSEQKRKAEEARIIQETLEREKAWNQYSN